MSQFSDSQYTTAPLTTEPLPKNNTWIWIVLAIVIPLGGLTCCCGGGALTFVGAVSQVASSETYTEAVRRAREDARVKEALGEPINTGFSVKSKFNSHNGVGEMTLEIPLTGPKGSATLDVAADNKTGAWKYSKLEVRPATGEPIDLRSEAEKGQTP